MLGSIINATTIIAGGTLGALLKTGIAERYRRIIVREIYDLLSF